MRKNKLFTAITVAAAITSMTAMTAVNYSAEERILVKAERAAKDESTETTTETAEAGTQTTEGSAASGNTSAPGSANAQNIPERPEQDMDMSGLTLPEGFKPFDEEHKPDGTMAPANGEIKPIEFDADGNMIYGQPPQMGENGQAPSFNGQQPPQMRGEHRLPAAEILRRTDVQKKLLERHRKYIIAGAEILNGDYPQVARYMAYIKLIQE